MGTCIRTGLVALAIPLILALAAAPAAAQGSGFLPDPDTWVNEGGDTMTGDLVMESDVSVEGSNRLLLNGVPLSAQDPGGQPFLQVDGDRVCVDAATAGACGNADTLDGMTSGDFLDVETYDSDADGAVDQAEDADTLDGRYATDFPSNQQIFATSNETALEGSRVELHEFTLTKRSDSTALVFKYRPSLDVVEGQPELLTLVLQDPSTGDEVRTLRQTFPPTGTGLAGPSLQVADARTGPNALPQGEYTASLFLEAGSSFAVTRDPGGTQSMGRVFESTATIV